MAKPVVVYCAVCGEPQTVYTIKNRDELTRIVCNLCLFRLYRE